MPACWVRIFKTLVESYTLRITLLVVLLLLVNVN